MERPVQDLPTGGFLVLSEIRRLIAAWRTMYDACRTDYPCEGCEQGRIMAARNATAWAWTLR